jgi:hypothetical protein
MSSNPMRYSPAFGGGRTMEEDERGKYVKFDDYAAATSRAESAEQLAETVASQLRAAVDAFEAAEKRANDYHRRAQKMAAALAREIATGGGPSLGRALANAGYEAEKTLREAAEGKLEKVQEFALAYSASLSEFARFSIHAILAPDTGGEKGES